MRRTLLASFVASLLLGASTAMATPTTKAPALAKDGWPESDLGALARRWTQAFSKGEQAMRETLPQILSAASLAKRSMDSRMETYRGLHERFGSLMPVSVDSTGADALKVTLATSDMSQYQFTFTAPPASPRRLTNVRMMDRRPGGHGGRFGH